MPTSSIQSVLAYASIPAVAVVVGGVAAGIRAPGPRTTSGIQHFSAGVVFAALATELLPEVVHRRLPVATIIGFALGVAVMLGVKALTSRSDGATGAADRLPVALLVALAIDIALDGLLVGIGFTAGARQGLLLTIALTLEVLFLGISATAALGDSKTSRTVNILIVAGLGATLLSGAAIGFGVLSRASAGTLDIVLSFGVAALLYLVTEELLVEAHEVPETPLLTSMFFVGFLALLITDMLI